MRVIEVYVGSEERLKGTANGDYSIYDEHPCQVKYNIIKTLCPGNKVLAFHRALSTSKSHTVEEEGATQILAAFFQSERKTTSDPRKTGVLPSSPVKEGYSPLDFGYGRLASA